MVILRNGLSLAVLSLTNCCPVDFAGRDDIETRESESPETSAAMRYELERGASVTMTKHDSDFKPFANE